MKSQLHGLREREHYLWRFENRAALFLSTSLCGYGKRKMDWSGEREESARQRDQCPTAAQRAGKKIKCFSLLLGSSRCAGLVTLATGNGAEHLIGVCHMQGEVKMFKWKINALLANAHLEKRLILFRIKAVLSSFYSHNKPLFRGKAFYPDESDGFVSRSQCEARSGLPAISPVVAAATQPFQHSRYR